MRGTIYGPVLCWICRTYKGASPAPLPGGRARARPVGKRKKVFGVVRNSREAVQRNFQPPLLHIHGKAPGHTECEQRSLCNGARLWGFVCSRTSCGQAASPYCSSSRLVTRHAPLSLARNKPSVVTNRGYADTNKKNVSCRTHTMPLPSLVGRSYHTSLYF